MIRDALFSKFCHKSMAKRAENIPVLSGRLVYSINSIEFYNQ